MAPVIPKAALYYGVDWGLNPPLPLRNTTPFFLAKPPLNQQTVQAPLFRQSSPSILFFCEPLPPPPPLKVGFFSEPPNY